MVLVVDIAPELVAELGKALGLVLAEAVLVYFVIWVPVFVFFYRSRLIGGYSDYTLCSPACMG